MPSVKGKCPFVVRFLITYPLSTADKKERDPTFRKQPQDVAAGESLTQQQWQQQQTLSQCSCNQAHGTCSPSSNRLGSCSRPVSMLLLD